MLLDVSDEVQLLESTFRDRAIFTFNIKDFLVLDRKQSEHSGIIFTSQNSLGLSVLMVALDATFSTDHSAKSIERER